MLIRRSLLALLILALAAMPAVTQEKDKDKDKDKDKKDNPPVEVKAGEKVDLKWKFELNKPFYQQLTTETTQDMKVMGQPVSQKQNQTFYFSWTPIKQTDKIWVIKQKIEGVKVEIEIGGNKIAYDSTNKGTGNNPLADFFGALIGSEFELTIGPDMKVTKVEGGKVFLDKLVAANQQMKPLLESILSDDALKQMADPSFAVLPTMPVAKGDKWDSKTQLKLGPIGTYDTTYNYVYEGKEKELDKISVAATLKYSPPDASAPAGLPFKIKSAKLESKSASGVVLFDSAAGRVESSELALKLEGTLDIEIGGQTTTVELKQDQKTTVKTTAELPAALKPAPKSN